MSSFLESDSLLESRKIESFSDIKIPTKFFMSLALLVIGLTFMGAAYYQTIVIEEKAQVRSNELAEFTKLINGIEINIARCPFLREKFPDRPRPGTAEPV